MDPENDVNAVNQAAQETLRAIRRKPQRTQGL